MITLKEHNIKNVRIKDLKFDKTNPNQLTQEQMVGLRESMTRFGYLTPIVIDENNLIADGEHRALIYKEFGLDEIPAYQLNFKDDSERRLLRQVMNKLHGIHDKQLDADELTVLFENNKLEDLSKLIAAEQDDLKRLINRYHPEVAFAKPEEFEEINEEDFNKMVPDTQLGDIYELGKHRLICADSSDKRSVDRLLEGKKVNMVLTDPPYGMNLDTDWSDAKTSGKFLQDKHCEGGHKYEKVVGDNQLFDPSYIFETFSYCPEIFLFGADYYSKRLPDEGSWFVWDKRVEETLDAGYGSVFEMCWSKNKHKREIMRVKWFGIFGTEKQDIKHRIHPTQKPTQLMEWLIKRFSKEGDSVCDVYSGSGSTLIACEQTNRKCYAMEIDPRYVDIIKLRWEKYTGQKAIKLA